MLAKMIISALRLKFLAAEVAHRVPAWADELVASGALDEGEIALGTYAFDGCCLRGFE